MRDLRLKIDLHVHTRYSYDSTITLDEIVAYSQKRGLDGVAITDHDVVEGALKLVQKVKELVVIPGVEVTTSRGHVLALNITRPIPTELSPLETIQMIHEAGGIAVAAHPTVFYKGLRGQINSNFDAVEVVNASAFPFFLSTYLSRKLALRLDLPQTAGSDAHYASEIGFAYTVVDTDPEVDEIVHAIRNGATVPCGKPIPWKLRLERMLQP
ncbi:PHP domain-containing protein [Candidatus Bathyarchaeota archaeon]|nr:MAG: PHP domain-containing protein [Candidatus Bathyarchaeota archaeon]TEU07547.1 MAG: PHP domain-containing protein [Candidatus Bathyarchaeota archaeon]